MHAATELGTPQGGNLSPLLSNVMLNELDKELLKRRLHNRGRQQRECYPNNAHHNQMDRAETRIKGQCHQDPRLSTEQTQIPRI